MNITFFDGLDELCHHAKFGEDRTTCAGCWCENMVFVCFLGWTRSIEPISYGNVAGWLAGCLSVCHSRYCIKTTKPTLKLFWTIW